MPMTIQTYTLSPPAMVTQDAQDSFKTSGFEPVYRKFLMDRLPVDTVGRNLFLCIYCGNAVGRRGTQIEHLVPVKEYCRSELLRGFVQDRQRSLEDDRNRDMQDRIKVRNACHDTLNLFLSCNTCNASKRDQPLSHLTVADCTRVINASGLPKNHQRTLVGKLQAAIMKIKTNAGDSYYAKGPGPIRRSRREAAQKSGYGPVSSRTPTRDTPYSRRSSTKSELHKKARDTAKTDLEFLIIDSFTRARPNWPMDTRPTLETLQALPRAAVNSKLCFYCLGWYSDAAFQIDHIKPTAGKVASGHVKRVYNNSLNLIPVCRTCNGSKNSKALTREMIEGFIARREAEGLAGLVGDDKNDALARILVLFSI